VTAMTPQTTTGSDLRRGWRTCWLLAFLLVIVVVECFAARALHRTDEELRTLSATGTPAQQVYALFVQTNRGAPHALDQPAVRRLLQSDDPLVREWTMTTNFVRLAPPRVQEDYIAALRGAPEAVRCGFWLTYRIGLGQSMQLADLRRFLDALKADSYH
jgi:hypothetical protein